MAEKRDKGATKEVESTRKNNLGDSRNSFVKHQGHASVTWNLFDKENHNLKQ